MKLAATIIAMLAMCGTANANLSVEVPNSSSMFNSQSDAAPDPIATIKRIYPDCSDQAKHLDIVVASCYLDLLDKLKAERRAP
jgi:hypothetical protein